MEWYQILGIVFGILAIDSMIGAIIYAAAFDNWSVFIPMPSDFKCYTYMNWLGSTVCYILLFILFPILNIGKVVYWLFHI